MRIWSRAIIALVIVVAAPASEADNKAPVAQIDTLMTKQAAAMVADDSAALAATLAKDGFVSTGGRPVSGDVSMPTRISMGPATIELGAKSIAWRGEWGWIDADVKIVFRIPKGWIRASQPASRCRPLSRSTGSSSWCVMAASSRRER